MLYRVDLSANCQFDCSYSAFLCSNKNPISSCHIWRERCTFGHKKSPSLPRNIEYLSRREAPMRFVIFIQLHKSHAFGKDSIQR